MDFTILDLKEINIKNIKAKFRLKFSALEIKDCAYMVKDDKKWIGTPYREYTDKDGTKKYFNLVALDKWLADKVLEKVESMLNVDNKPNF